MKPSHLVLGLAVLAGAARAQPVTEAVDPAMIRARDFLQQLDRGEYEQALVGADERLAKRGAERFASDVQKERRGVAMSTWGATAGVATLVGPLAGGALVDGLGWQWIFIVNVPVGIIGLGLALWLVPELDTQTQRFDLIGVALSGIGMFMIVFALQEGQSHDWAPWIWGTIAGGIGFRVLPRLMNGRDGGAAA